MKRKFLQKMGFVYKGTNSRGTEVFTFQGIEVRSYLSGYVRQCKPMRSRWDGKIEKRVWQMNLKDDNGARILLPTHEERYYRLANWALNK